MNDMSLKAKIRNIASKKNISASAVLQNYLNNRFLFRLAKSEYRERFIVKGGMLISSIIGVNAFEKDGTIKVKYCVTKEMLVVFGVIFDSQNKTGSTEGAAKLLSLNQSDRFLF